MNFPRWDDATNKELILTIIEIQGYLSRYGKSHTNWHETLNEVIERLERAERPQRMRGKWIGGELGRCSVCGHEGNASDIWNGCKGMFCPNCGADMRETE